MQVTFSIQVCHSGGTHITPAVKKMRKMTAPEVRKVVYGWLPDIPARLPARIDLRKTCSPVEDQKDLGSCTANALAGALEFLMKKDQAPFVDMSRLFIYDNERVIEHSVKTVSGL